MFEELKKRPVCWSLTTCGSDRRQDGKKLAVARPAMVLWARTVLCPQSNAKPQEDLNRR